MFDRRVTGDDSRQTKDQTLCNPGMEHVFFKNFSYVGTNATTVYHMNFNYSPIDPSLKYPSITFRLYGILRHKRGVR